MESKLTPAEAEAISRISSLVLVNAMIFQEILASHGDYRVSTLEKLKDEENVIGALSSQWRDILKINYYPIFNLARELRNLPLHHLALARGVPHRRLQRTVAHGDHGR